jgi:phosphate starvation-inducible PhoH-like protein
LIPRNISQENFIEILQDEDVYIAIATGSAGSGKTYIATQYAIKKYQEGECKKIVITRPQVSVDEKLGYLPGDLREKSEPWLLPILDVFKLYYSVKTISNMIENEIIEIAPLAFMRGRTLTNSIIIADEMQNSTVSQMKMMLTRIGENSKIIITGDLNQHDRGYEGNGIKDFVSRLKHFNTKGMRLIEFSPKDIVRHPIIEDVLRMYGEE